MIATFIAWIHASKYILLFLGAFLEGPVVMIGAGFLYKLGQVDFIYMYIALVAGDFVADIMWYAIGFFGASTLVTKYGKFLNITPEIISKIEKRFKAYQTTILIVSKLTMGFGFALATLITAGILKAPFKKFATINLLGGFIWSLVMVGVGYFFGNVYMVIPTSYKLLFIGIILFIVIGTLHMVNRYLVEKEI